MRQDIPKVQLEEMNLSTGLHEGNSSQLEAYIVFNVSSDFDFSKHSLPSSIPSQIPSLIPSASPSASPSLGPSVHSTSSPSILASSTPTVASSSKPSVVHSSKPSAVPSSKPSVAPSSEPTVVSSTEPTTVATSVPSIVSSGKPTIVPTNIPTIIASSEPTLEPSWAPSVVSSSQPTIESSSVPTMGPSLTPSALGSSAPTVLASTEPSLVPSTVPSIIPSSFPTIVASTDPTIASSALPSIMPSSEPTNTVSSSPSMNVCGDFENYNPPPQKLTLDFDYEVIVDASFTNTTAIVETLEKAFLEDLLSNILDCDIAEMRALRSNKSRFLQDETATEIIGIESDPLDLPNANPCVEADGIASNEICVPFKGGMTYYTTCESCPAEREEILLTIKSGCENDIYADGDIIKEVTYIGAGLGNRIIDNSGFAPNANNKPKVTQGNSFIYIATASLIALVAAVQVYRKKRRERDLDGTSLDSESMSENDSAESA